jgi:hypothetical protein
MAERLRLGSAPQFIKPSACHTFEPSKPKLGQNPIFPPVLANAEYCH